MVIRTHIVYIAVGKMDGMIYVGSTSLSLKDRVRCHLSDMKRGKRSKFISYISSTGIDNISFKQLTDRVPKEEAILIETMLTKFLMRADDGKITLNLRAGNELSDSQLLAVRRIRGEDVKKRMSVAQRTVKRNNHGVLNSNYDNKIYSFHHSEHGMVASTQYDLRTRFCLNASCVSELINGTPKTHKGWALARLEETDGQNTDTETD